MNKNVHSSFVGGQVSCVAQAVRALVAAAALCTPALGLAHAAFADPEQAAKALIQAIERDDAKAMARVLGKDWRRLLPPDGVDPEDKRAFLDMAREAQAVKKTDGRADVVIGKDEWPLPIPIVQGKDGKWRFDIAGGREAMLDRRIGYNERSAMQAALAYVDAQREYALADRNGDGLLEYAQKFRSSPGKRDGLIWSPSLGDDSPIGEDFVPVRKGLGYHGYNFKILTGQGPKASPDGARSYLLGKRMTSGFGLLAWPVRYGETGVMSFMVNQKGQLYERDLGPGTAKAVSGIKLFNPDDGWKTVAP